jgi:hypothetical protein
MGISFCPCTKRVCDIRGSNGSSAFRYANDQKETRPNAALCAISRRAGQIRPSANQSAKKSMLLEKSSSPPAPVSNTFPPAAFTIAQSLLSRG